MTDAIVVLVSAASAEEAARMARTLVDERLVACANIVPGVRSIYRWEGKVVEEDECLLVLKSCRPRFGELERRVRELHRYDLPEILALEVGRGSAPYLEWLREETER